MTHTMTSSGLVIVMTKACGQCCLIACADGRRSTLGVGADQIVAAHARACAAMPAVTMTTSAPAISA